MPDPIDPLKLETPEATATLLGVTVGTLAVWRSTKRYPLAWCRVGRRIMYPRHSISSFIASRTEGTNEGHELKLAAG